MTKTTKVWIVSRGEKHEGGSVRGVFKSKRAARKLGLSLEPHFGPWEKVEGEIDTWESGCDEIILERHPVQ